VPLALNRTYIVNKEQQDIIDAAMHHLKAVRDLLTQAQTAVLMEIVPPSEDMTDEIFTHENEEMSVLSTLGTVDELVCKAIIALVPVSHRGWEMYDRLPYPILKRHT
jgi:hypothetical protein